MTTSTLVAVGVTLAIICWSGSAVLGLIRVGTDAPTPPGTRRPRRWPDRASWALLQLGAVALVAVVATLAFTLNRPPLRTLGETRMMVAVALAAVALAVEWRFKTRVVRVPMALLGITFVSFNLAHPDALDRTLMPALQSAWFVPHVVAYLSAYATLALAFGAAVAAAISARFTKPARPLEWPALKISRLLLRLGLPLLTCGLGLGMLWAKAAWGHYWAWDPKENWALITWAAYVGVMHADLTHRLSPRGYVLAHFGAFAVVLGGWFLVNVLPATADSIHTYAM